MLQNKYVTLVMEEKQAATLLWILWETMRGVAENDQGDAPHAQDLLAAMHDLEPVIRVQTIDTCNTFTAAWMMQAAKRALAKNNYFSGASNIESGDSLGTSEEYCRILDAMADDVMCATAKMIREAIKYNSKH